MTARPPARSRPARARPRPAPPRTLQPGEDAGPAEIKAWDDAATEAAIRAAIEGAEAVVAPAKAGSSAGPGKGGKGRKGPARDPRVRPEDDGSVGVKPGDDADASEAGPPVADGPPLDAYGDEVAGGDIGAAPDPKGDDEEIQRPRRGQRPDGLPEGIPVEPLGVSGDTYYYLDALRQVRALDPRKHDKKFVASLFGTQTHLLEAFWPRYNKEGDPAGWNADDGAMALMQAAARKGIWDPLSKERGSGAWRGEDGQLILHCGDRIWDGKGWRKPGFLGAYVYPGAPAVPRPAKEAEPGGDAGVGAELLAILRSWNWARGELDARLLLGWIGAAVIGGALKWRSTAWITGDRGTGKSTLQDQVLEGLFGGAMVHPAEPTAAGVWQKVGKSSLPVAIDEAEPDDHGKIAKIIELARIASSGGTVLRGGANHQSSEFTVRSAFLFSSILVPPLKPQDLSRLAILKLLPLPGDAVLPDLSPQRMRELGQRLRRRMLDRWEAFQEVLETWRLQLATHAGHAGRGADQFGGLMAAADVLLSDHPPDTEALETWSKLLKADSLSETADNDPGWRRCYDWLMAQRADAYRQGDKLTVGELISIVMWPRTDGVTRDDAERQLNRVGIKVRVDTKSDPERWYLVIANRHEGLFKLYADSVWRAGGHAQALADWPSSSITTGLHFAGVQSRARILPVSAEDFDPAAEGRATADAIRWDGEDAA